MRSLYQEQDLSTFDFRAAHAFRRQPCFEHRRLGEIPLSSRAVREVPSITEAFLSFPSAAGIQEVHINRAIINSDPRRFSKLVIYACAFRRGELPEFKNQTGLRFAGPKAAWLAHHEQVVLPSGTIFPGFTCYGELLFRSVWLTLESRRSYTHQGKQCMEVAGLAGNQVINFVACVE